MSHDNCETDEFCGICLEEERSGFREEIDSLKNQVNKIVEMWESERTAVKNITEMYGDSCHQVEELREALYALLRFSTKPQPRDEEEQERVVAKVAKALKSAGKLDEREGT